MFFFAWLRNPTPIKICEGKSEDSNYSVCCMRSLQTTREACWIHRTSPGDSTKKVYGTCRSIVSFPQKQSVVKVDGSEIWRSPKKNGKLSHYLTWFHTCKRWFFPEIFHQQYGKRCFQQQALQRIAPGQAMKTKHRQSAMHRGGQCNHFPCFFQTHETIEWYSSSTKNMPQTH